MRLLTPPVVAILITSTPRATCSRTARRQASAPSHRFSSRSQRVVQVVAEAERGVHVPRGGRDRRAGIDDAWARAPCRHAIASRSASVTPSRVAEVAHRGEAGGQRLAGVDEALYALAAGLSCTCSSWAATPPASVVRCTWLSMRPGSTNRAAQVDDLGARKLRQVRAGMTAAHLDHPAVTDHDGARSARCMAGTVEQLAGLDQNGAGRLCLRHGRGRGEQGDGSEQRGESMHAGTAPARGVDGGALRPGRT